MRRLREQLYDIAERDQPLTVRQLFYRMVVAAVIKKTQNEYKNVVSRISGQMWEDGELPWSWIVDETRWMRKPRSYADISHALQEMQNWYRRDLWASAGVHLEVWVESDSIAGTLFGVTSQ